MFKYEDIVQQGCLFGFLEKAGGEGANYKISQKGKRDFKKLLGIVDSNKKEFEQHVEKATKGLGHLCEMVYIERFANGLRFDSFPEEIRKELNKELVRLADRSPIAYDGIIGMIAYYLKPKEIKPVSCLGKHKD